jgi:hypothetical protein
MANGVADGELTIKIQLENIHGNCQNDENESFREKVSHFFPAGSFASFFLFH